MKRSILLGLVLTVGIFFSGCVNQGGNASTATTGGVGTAPETTPGNTGPKNGAVTGIGTSSDAAGGSSHGVGSSGAAGGGR